MWALAGTDRAWLAFATAVAAFAASALSPEAATRFQNLTIPIAPWMTVLLAGVAGLVALSPAAFASDPRRLRGWVVALVAGPGAMALAAVAVAGDTTIRFPAGMNVAFPQSLLFYPALAIIAEVAFHLTPLGLAGLLLQRARRQAIEAAIPGVLFGVALVEPVFQLLAADAATPWWGSLFVAAQVLAVNLGQLWLFRRSGFAAMLIFRLSYYAVWHVIWGELRLALLF